MKRSLSIVALVLAGLFAASGLAAAAPSSVTVSPDITVGLSGTFLYDEHLVEDDLMGSVSFISPGIFSSEAAIVAYHEEANGNQLFVLESTTLASGLSISIVVTPRDVVRWNLAFHTIEFDGEAEGVPAGVAIDGLSRDAGGDLLLSFDTTAALPGPLVVEDEDVVSWDGAAFALVFDGSAEGVASGLDVDGVHDLGGGLLALSFDTDGAIGGVVFADEDVLEFDPSGPTWTLVYDGDALHADLVAADVDAIAVPEPAPVVALLAGALGLAALHRRRIRRV